MLFRSLYLILLFALLSACAPTTTPLQENVIVNENPALETKAVVSPGTWLIRERNYAALFDMPAREINRFNRYKGKFELVGIDAPKGWRVELREVEHHRNVTSRSGNTSTFIDYIDLSFSVTVPAGFSGRAPLTALVAYGDHREEVSFLLGSDKFYINTDGGPFANLLDICCI